MAIKIYIQGSRLTREIFEFQEKSNFKPVHYSEKPAFAALSYAFFQKSSHSSLQEKRLSHQNNMIPAHQHQHFFPHLINKDFDFILIDFMNEKYGLVNINNWSINYLDSKTATTHDSIQKNGFQTTYGNNEYLQDILSGFDLFYDNLKSIGKSEKLIVNKIFWATHDEHGKALFSMLTYINKANELLSEIYCSLERNYTNLKFINYGETVFITRSKLKNGLNTYYYIDKIYKKALIEIENYCEESIVLLDPKLRISDNYMYFNAHFKKSNFEIEYAAYLFKNKIKINTQWYQDSPNFVFSIQGAGSYEVQLFCRIKYSKIIKKYLSDEIYHPN